MHGGAIEVQSDGLAHGSCFRVRLPLAEAEAAPAPATPVSVAPQRHCRAMVLDDNRDAANTLAMMLELLGHEVRCLYDPREAAEVVAEFDPEVVFLDIGMPGVSGYEIARRLRVGAHGDSRLLVAVTGWGQPDDLRRTAEAGFDHHLVKPPELEAIRALCAGAPTRVRAGS